jgi:hypothetical protein
VLPGVVAVGTPTLATGRGFPPGAQVRLGWLLADGGVRPPGTAATVGPDGGFSATVLVLPHDRLGPRRLVASDGGAPAGTGSAAGPAVTAADVLVVAGSSQPGRHGLVSRR